MMKCCSRRLRCAGALLLAAACAAGCGGGPAPAASASGGAAAAPATEAAWRPLFDGKSLDGWKASRFPAHGDVSVEDGALVLGMGEASTGVTWAGGPLPKTDYEVELEARRVEGPDFFCGLTFPVGDSAASLIVGGWGGRLVGISCIDGFDASSNETTQGMKFERNRWYRIRVKVTAAKIEVWIDDTKVADVSREGKTIAVRPDIEESLPFGVASWRTVAHVRGIRMRKILNPKQESKTRSNSKHQMMSKAIWLVSLLLAAACVADPPSPVPETVRIAGIVLKWVRGDKAANFRRAEPMIREATANGAAIVVTTECFLDGYAISDKGISREAFWPLGEPIPDGPWLKRLTALADELDIHRAHGP